MIDMKIAIFFIPIFLVNPLFAIIGMALYMISAGNIVVRDSKKGDLVLFGLLCCIFVSLVNMTKVPESDLMNYVYLYQSADNYSLYSYLYQGTYDKSGAMKEPLYSTLVWVLNRIYQGEVKPFLFTISMIEYVLSVLAVLYFGQKLKMRQYVILAGIVLMCFLPYIFTHTMHLIRQTIANAILCYVMVKHIFYKKREWVAMVIMALMHSTSALYLPLLLIPGYGKPFKKAWIWFAAAFGLLVGIRVVSQSLLGTGAFESDSSVAYALGRATGEYSYGMYTLGTSIVFLIILMLIFTIFIYFGKLIPSSDELRQFTFIFIFTALFILMNLQQDLLAARYSHYLFSLFPFIIMIGFQKWKTDNIFLFLFSLGIIWFFTMYLGTGAWTYEISAGPWVTPVFMYMF